MSKKIYIVGHNGMVGSALVRQLAEQSEIELVTQTRDELDLLNQSDVNDFFKDNKIDEVYLAAAKVGGIHANNEFPAEFIYQNLMIQSNVIHAAYMSGVPKLMFLGSSCIYPKLATQPMQESSLLTGELEPTNEPYAIAKIAGIKLCESYRRQYHVDYRSVMPTNLYGENDNFHPEHSHVIPALMRRIHEAKVNSDETVTIWGTGMPRREFLHVDDMAAASIHVMNLSQADYLRITNPRLTHINVGVGEDCTIKELAETLVNVIGYQGELVFDSSKPDGTPRKLLDVTRLKQSGWQASISLADGLHTTYKWFLDNHSNIRGKNQ